MTLGRDAVGWLSFSVEETTASRSRSVECDLSGAESGVEAPPSDLGLSHANVGGLSGRLGGWEEEEELDFGGRGFLGR